MDKIIFSDEIKVIGNSSTNKNSLIKSTLLNKNDNADRNMNQTKTNMQNETSISFNPGIVFKVTIDILIQN